MFAMTYSALINRNWYISEAFQNHFEFFWQLSTATWSNQFSLDFRILLQVFLPFMIVFLDSFDKKRQIKADLYFKVLNHAFWTSEHSIFFPKNSHTHTRNQKIWTNIYRWCRFIHKGFCVSRGVLPLKEKSELKFPFWIVLQFSRQGNLYVLHVY